MVLSNPKDRYRVVACRECRRSKTKCNRVWPCQACVKRGCEDICPDGVLIKPKTDKLLDSSPEAADLLQENKKLAARIRELEKAAMSPQASSSSHSDTSSSSDPGARETFPEEMVNAFGTLSIGEFGESNHHNQAASAEYLLQDDLDCERFSRDVIALDGNLLPNEILYIAELFPNGRSIRSTPELRNMILSFVPPADKVLILIDRYYRNLAWMYDPIPRDQFMDRVYNRIFYGNRYGDVSTIAFDHVALLFIVLALSVMTDLEQTYGYATSEPYYLLALAAFSLETKLSAPTLASIQTLQLVTTYSCMCERSNAEERWLLMGITIRMAQSAGLYRDFSSWLKCDAAEIERRRKVFWELFVYDTWLSFIMGRPAVLANSKQIETKFPQDLHSTMNIPGDPQPGFHHWKYKFASECLVPLLDEVLGAEPPTYQKILRLDALIRQYPVPSSLQVPSVNMDSKRRDVLSGDTSLEMQTYFVLWLKETSLLYLHRSYFAHVLSTAPANPLKSKYAPSVLAAYRSAALLVGRLRQLNADHPVTSRIWTFWSSVFSAAIVLGALVVRSPGCQLSRCALDELDSAVMLLEGGLSSPRSMKAWTILQNLQRRAHLAFTKQNSGVLDAPKEAAAHEQEIEEDELTIFGGQTRLVLGSTVTDVGGNVRQTSSPSIVNSSPSIVNPKTVLPSPPNALSNTYPELYNDINTFTPFEQLPTWNAVPLQGANCTVPDVQGFTFETSAGLQEYDLPTSATMHQTPVAWQNLMSEVGMANVEY